VSLSCNSYLTDGAVILEQADVGRQYAPNCMPPADNPEGGKGMSFSGFQDFVSRVSADQPPGLGVKIEVRKGSDNLDAFAETLVSDLREHFPPDMQRVSPATRSVIIANYERMVGGELGGHWNVLGGVRWRPSAAEPDHDKTYVLITSGDVGLRKLPTHWITLRQFVKACSSLATLNNAYRGYVVLTADDKAKVPPEGALDNAAAAGGGADAFVDDATTAAASLTIS
jgi:hypothetical protein